MSGILHGVGLGPGDPELMTLRAHRLICTARVVAYPAPEENGAAGDSFARSIAAALIPQGAEEIAIAVPMRADPDAALGAYDQGAAAIAERLAAGLDVVTLCEGDPLFYGSFMYLMARLADRFTVEITPGVSSITACAAALRHPLCARNETLAVVPATLPDDEILARIGRADAVAIMKLGRHLPRLRQLLERLDLAEAHYIERATLPEQTIAPLAEAPETAPYFSMILARRKTASKGGGQWPR